MKNNDFSTNLYSLIKWVFIGIMTLILIMCIFFSNADYKTCNYDNLIGNGKFMWMYLIIGLLFVLTLFYFLQKKEIKLSNKQLFLMSFILLIIQIFLIYNYYFRSNWDPEILIQNANALAQGADPNSVSEYYSQYPNNLLLLFVFKTVFQITYKFGLNFDYGYALLICLQCFLSCVVSFLLYKVIYKLLDNGSYALLGWIVYILLIGLSPWISIVYSDGMSLIFPILVLSIYYLIDDSKRILKYFLLGLLAYISLKIKPQNAIISIAIVIVDFIYLFRKNETLTNKVKTYLKQVISWGIGIGMTYLVCTLCISSLGMQLDKNREFGITHFLMMGLNKDSQGVWAPEDVELSYNASTYEERKQLNLEVSEERIEEYGLSGLMDLWHKKVLINYNDGTFAWGYEGDALQKYGTDYKPLSALLRSLIYKDEEGVNRKYFYSFEQAIWYSVLFMMIFCFKRSKDHKTMSVMYLTILGLTLFEMLFEPRGRYLFSNGPIYIILAICGLHEMKKCFKRNS